MAEERNYDIDSSFSDIMRQAFEAKLRLIKDIPAK